MNDEIGRILAGVIDRLSSELKRQNDRLDPPKISKGECDYGKASYGDRQSRLDSEFVEQFSAQGEGKESQAPPIRARRKRRSAK